MSEPVTEYFTIISRYRAAPTNPVILAATPFQLRELLSRASPRLAQAVNQFLALHFREPETNTG